MERDLIKGTSVCCAWCTVSVCCVCKCVYKLYVLAKTSDHMHVHAISTVSWQTRTHTLSTYMYISSTIKQDCKAGVKLSLSDDGQHLVNEVNEEHNHDISKVCQS